LHALHTVRLQRETVSAISLKRVSAIGEMRNLTLADQLPDGLPLDLWG
jgi:16S rRNA U516 pseudouridylate synthase RsuA-like enzyme